MTEDIVTMARAAMRDERLSDGALYGKLADEIERLKAAIAWTREVRPGKNAESGGAIVHMTWDQFNTMRALAKP